MFSRLRGGTGARAPSPPPPAKGPRRPGPASPGDGSGPPHPHPAAVDNSWGRASPCLPPAPPSPGALGCGPPPRGRCGGGGSAGSGAGSVPAGGARESPRGAGDYLKFLPGDGRHGDGEEPGNSMGSSYHGNNIPVVALERERWRGPEVPPPPVPLTPDPPQPERCWERPLL